MRLNPGRVKPAGVAAGVLWDVVVWTLPGLRGRGVVLVEDFWKGSP
ncbi:MAG: hypothetical protein QOH50_5197 [Kribbellaceae bacterium]|jgi:hypothetical protein|nr:hypothetical protein [Kribbellaceae bacterium]